MLADTAATITAVSGLVLSLATLIGVILSHGAAQRGRTEISQQVTDLHDCIDALTGVPVVKTPPAI